MGALKLFFGNYIKRVASEFGNELKSNSKTLKDETIKAVIGEEYTEVQEDKVPVYSFYIWNDDSRFEEIGQIRLNPDGNLCYCINEDYSEAFSRALIKVGE